MVTIITKWYCPFCHAAMDILDMLHLDYTETDISDNDDYYTKIQEITGSATVPQVFIWDIYGKFLGWYTELNALYKSGDLEKMLK